MKIPEITDQLIEEIHKRLSLAQNDDNSFYHGQIAECARYLVQECGHEWVLRIYLFPKINTDEARQLRSFRNRLMGYLQRTVTAQGKDKYAFKRQFLIHIRKIAMRVESRVVVKRIAEMA